jgi:hypothetical protein
MMEFDMAVGRERKYKEEEEFEYAGYITSLQGKAM